MKAQYSRNQSCSLKVYICIFQPATQTTAHVLFPTQPSHSGPERKGFGCACVLSHGRETRGTPEWTQGPRVRRMNGFFCLSRTLRRERSVLAAGLRPEVRTQGHVRGGWPGPRREPGHMGPRGPGGQQRLAQGPGGPRSQALVGPLGAAALPTDPFPTPWACAAWPAVKTLPPAFPGWGLPHRPGQGHPSQPPPPRPHHRACFLLSRPCGWRGCAGFFGHRGADGQHPRSMAGPCRHFARSAKDKAISVEIGIARCSTFSLCQTVWL